MNKHLGIDIHGISPDWLTDFAKDLLLSYYTETSESIPQAFARASTAFSFGDMELAQRLYHYAYKGWFSYASPVLSNAPKIHWPHTKKNPWIGTRFSKNSKWLKKNKDKFAAKGMPISCFLSYVPDTIDGQIEASAELKYLSISGGGVGLHNKLRAVSDKAPGPVPYIKTNDADILYYKQGKTRKGAAAIYLDVSHPDILEFINIRKPTGGDPNRKAYNIHNAVNITYDFLEAVGKDWDWDLVCPSSMEVKDTVKARELWEALLDTRYKTGEPYLNNIDEANLRMPNGHRGLGLKIHGSNLCNEIHLPTDEQRTAVCCLSSVNLAKYDEWKDTQMIEDLIEMLDNVIEYFTIMAPDVMAKAKYSALRSRDIGLGAMGWHEYLQAKGIPFEGGGFGSAIQETNTIFSNIKNKAKQKTIQLGAERGQCPDAGVGTVRNMHLLAIAPNANSSIILGTTPGIEPIKANAYIHRTRLGTRLVKNPVLGKLLLEKLKTISKVDEAWDSIVSNKGSVQHLDFLTDKEKSVFKTFEEIDQKWVILQARHRQPYLCQGQSVNIVYPSGAKKWVVNRDHAMAFDPHLEEGHPLKGLYYLRTESIAKGEDVSKQVERVALKDFDEATDLDVECMGCDG